MLWSNASVNYINYKNIEKPVIGEIIFIKNPHILKYDQHIYNINKILEKDIKNNTTNIELLKNISYVRSYFINQIKKNKEYKLIKINKT